uniref:Uncharacterized protein n=1 Tax=Pseudonaja textilis TaxID=8673 RepID=A0A670YYT2_PSETE
GKEAADGGPSRRQRGPPRSTLLSSSIHLMTVPHYTKGDHFSHLTTVAASPWSREQNSDAWQPVHIYDGCYVPGSRDPLLQPSDHQKIHLTTMTGMQIAGTFWGGSRTPCT